MKKYDVRTTISYPTKRAMGKTGNWQVFTPNLDKKKCIKCLRCWIYCPEATVIRNKDDTVAIDLEYCKGCGICADVCKVKAIVMKRAGEKE